jgi:hypothetical protein
MLSRKREYLTHGSIPIAPGFGHGTLGVHFIGVENWDPFV